MGTINISSVKSPPKITSTVTVNANLDSTTTVHDLETPWNITNDNNTLKISQNGVSKTVSIAIGNYKTADLVQQIEQALNAAIGASGTEKFTVSYSPTGYTNEFVITNNTQNAVSLDLSDPNTTAGGLLGLGSTPVNVYDKYSKALADASLTTAVVAGNNDTIRFSYGGKSYTATIAAGAYGTIGALTTAIETALNTEGAAGAGGTTHNITDDTNSTPGNFRVTNSANKIVITHTNGGNVDLLWGTSKAAGYLGNSTKLSTETVLPSDEYTTGLADVASLTITNGVNDTIKFTSGGKSYTTTISDNGTVAYATTADLAIAIQTALNNAGGVGVQGTTYNTTDAAPGTPANFTVTASGNKIVISQANGTAAVPVSVDFLWNPLTSNASTNLGFSAKPSTETLLSSLTTAANFTNSVASYGNNAIFEVKTNNNQIAFNNGSDLIAELNVGSYTLEGMKNEIMNAMNTKSAAVGADRYTVDYDVTNKKFVIYNGDPTSAVPTNGNPLTIKWSNKSTTADQLLGFNSANDSDPISTTIGLGTGYIAGDFAATGFDALNSSTSSDFNTAITVYDSIGNGHMVSAYFKKTSESTAGNEWYYYAVVPSSDSLNGQVQVGAYGSMMFDTSGRLTANTQKLSNNFIFSGGVSATNPIQFDFGETTTAGGSGTTGTTQFGAANSISFQNQDGYSAGSLQSLVIDQSGDMNGIFTNGATKKVATVALYKFIAPTGLTKIGKNMYAESAGSGGPTPGRPGQSGMGTILASSLEMSNVDLADEFVKMISAQRGFQANTKIISTTDQMLTELMQLKQ